jgi:hypothetical protein
MQGLEEVLAGVGKGSCMCWPRFIQGLVLVGSSTKGELHAGFAGFGLGGRNMYGFGFRKKVLKSV